MWLVLVLLKPQEQGYRSLREINRSYTQPNKYTLGVDLKVHAVPPCPGAALPCMRYVSPKGQKWRKGSALQLRVMWVCVGHVVALLKLRQSQDKLRQSVDKLRWYWLRQSIARTRFAGKRHLIQLA
jgi:hypothetical protein